MNFYKQLNLQSQERQYNEAKQSALTKQTIQLKKQSQKERNFMTVGNRRKGAQGVTYFVCDIILFWGSQFQLKLWAPK